MIGLVFMMRCLSIGLYIGGGLLAAVVLVTIVSWLCRISWELFEANFVEQATWLRGKFAWIHLPKRHKRKKRVTK